MVTIQAAYWCMDFINYTLVLKDWSPTANQMRIHHVIGVFNCFSGVHITAIAKIGHLALICEASNIFLNIRDLMDKNTWSGIWATLNNLMFFLSYTLTRVILFPF